ncbi:MAG: hypothetical protein JXA46_02155 [Dehalococcoidales bacterium]|nr:hypothetical protein [Dehalococcoidales bacterium]
MKKIIGLAIAALIVITVAGVGTFAFFSDTETSTENTFMAGTLDLALSGGTQVVDSVTETWKIENLKPGDAGGNNGALTLKNNGTIAGYLNFSDINVDVTPGTGESHASDGVHDLSDALLVWIFIDANGNGVKDTGDVDLYGASTVYLSIRGIEAFDLSKVDIALAASGAAGDTTHITLKYQWANTNTEAFDNSCQGDSLTFGFTVNLTQDSKS